MFGYKFRFQHRLPPYIVDFVCLKAGLIVELDGGQHAVNQPYDQARTRYLETQGYRVLRFWNNEVLENLDGVLEVIADALREGSSR